MNTTSTDLASLARDFESPDWNSTKALAALYANKNDRSAVQAICHAMENLTDTDLLSTLMQLCHLIVIFDFPELENLLMERCQNSMHFALRMFFLLQAAMEDEIPELVFKTNRMWKQCELAAINAETTSPPRNRVCVENGAFKRRSKLDGASMTLSPPRMQRSSSFTTTLPSIPLYGDHDIVDSLSASTSLIPNQIISSPSQQYKQTDNIDPIELNPDVSIWNQQHNGDTSSRPVVNNVAVTTSGSPATSGQELLDLSAVSLTDSSNINGTSSTDTLRTSTQLTTDNSNDTTNTSLSSLSPPSSPRIRESDSTVPDQIASANPSYASAAPPSPATVATASQQEQIDHAADKAFGSSFSFRLRQLSGEGKSGKQRVYEYFYTELHMINSLFNISTALMSISLDNIPKLKEVRGRALHLLLAQINTQLIQSEYNPASLASTASSSSISSANSTVSALEAALFGSEGLTYGVEIPVVSGWVIVKIHPEDSFCLSSRNRIPYMMLIEVLAFETGAEDLLIPNQPQHENYTYHHDDELINSSAAEEDWVLLDDDDDTPKHSTLKQGFIELWQEKEKRIKDSSPFSALPGWRLAGVIVKSGDDLRQEQLASQLIFKMHQWFQGEKLPLFLRPYVVLATSSTTGLIECIPDTCSIDSLKKRIPNFGTLSNYYICSYGHRGSQKFRIAQTNFVESLAAYSIVCYLLQIKDRHNGNILLDVEGHMIHIDFGFMLSISPGNIGFELAPFKLNQEMVDLIGGPQSDMFKYFKTLLLSGFLEVRRHAEEMIMLVEVMSHHSKMACFNKGGGQVIPGLKERLALDKNEEQCLGLIDTLVSNSMKSWTTQSYDSYQYYTNGIL